MEILFVVKQSNGCKLMSKMHRNTFGGRALGEGDLGMVGSGCRRGVVVSGVRRMNEDNARRARLVPGWVTVRLRAGTPSRYVTSQLGQLSLASLRGRLIEYQLRLG